MMLDGQPAEGATAIMQPSALGPDTQGTTQGTETFDISKPLPDTDPAAARVNKFHADFTTKTQALAAQRTALEEKETVLAHREAQMQEWLATQEQTALKDGEVENLSQLRALWRQDQAQLMRPMLDQQVQREITELKAHPQYGPLFTEHLKEIAAEVRKYKLSIEDAFKVVCGDKLVEQGKAAAIKEMSEKAGLMASTKPGPAVSTTTTKTPTSMKESWEQTKAEMGSPWK